MSTDRSGERGSAAAALGISTSAFELLRTLVETRIGLHYPADRTSLLADKLTDLVVRHGLRSYLDLYYRLRYDEAQAQLWLEVADHLAVPETYFWRQPEQLIAAARLVRAHLDAGRKRVRIWSAACCSGEEPLSIAIALDDAGIDPDQVEIVASDGSPRLLERARRGLYSDRSVGRLPDALRDRHLARGTDGWRVDPKLHARVDWRLANLVDPAQVADLARADIIFCRNVFIYFSDATIRDVVATFERAMPEWGALFLGAAESLMRVGVGLRLAEVGDAFVYARSEEIGGPAVVPSSARALGAPTWPE